MKKIIYMLLEAIMAVGLFTGCEAKEEEPGKDMTPVVILDNKCDNQVYMMLLTGSTVRVMTDKVGPQTKYQVDMSRVSNSDLYHGLDVDIDMWTPTGRIEHLFDRSIRFDMGMKHTFTINPYYSVSFKRGL